MIYEKILVKKSKKGKVAFRTPRGFAAAKKKETEILKARIRKFSKKKI